MAAAAPAAAAAASPEAPAVPGTADPETGDEDSREVRVLQSLRGRICKRGRGRGGGLRGPRRGAARRGGGWAAGKRAGGRARAGVEAGRRGLVRLAGGVFGEAPRRRDGAGRGSPRSERGGDLAARAGGRASGRTGGREGRCLKRGLDAGARGAAGGARSFRPPSDAGLRAAADDGSGPRWEPRGNYRGGAAGGGRRERGRPGRGRAGPGGRLRRGCGLPGGLLRGGDGGCGSRRPRGGWARRGEAGRRAGRPPEEHGPDTCARPTLLLRRRRGLDSRDGGGVTDRDLGQDVVASCEQVSKHSHALNPLGALPGMGYFCERRADEYRSLPRRQAGVIVIAIPSLAKCPFDITLTPPAPQLL